MPFTGTTRLQKRTPARHNMVPHGVFAALFADTRLGTRIVPVQMLVNFDSLYLQPLRDPLRTFLLLVCWPVATYQGLMRVFLVGNTSCHVSVSSDNLLSARTVLLQSRTRHCFASVIMTRVYTKAHCNCHNSFTKSLSLLYYCPT